MWPEGDARAPGKGEGGGDGRGPSPHEPQVALWQRLRNGDDARLYCCESIREKDPAGNVHVMCAGVDLAPAMQSQGFDADDVIEQIESSCNLGGGMSNIPDDARQKIESVGKILNIGWIADGAVKEASIICPRSTARCSSSIAARL